jgi:hypothetical protein
MLADGDYQIVVTTYDGAGMWRDHLIDHRDIRDVAASPEEREIHTFSSSFWSDIPRPAHIGHVGFTVRGISYRLSWPPPEGDPAPSTALTMHFRLCHSSDETPTSVEWWGRKRADMSV